MNIKPLYQKISLQQIDLQDLTFNLTPITDDKISAQLRNSILRCGLIHPPLLIPNVNGTHTLIAGRQRLLATHRILARDSFEVLVLPAETPPATLLTMALQDILLTRPATPVEKALCWQKAVDFLGEDIAEKDFWPQLELSRQLNPAKLEKIAGLEHEIQLALHHGLLELKTTLKLINLGQADRKALFQIIIKLRPSSSNQRKLVDYCLELHHRQRRPVADILAEVDCAEIINHPEANPPQKTTMLMNWLTGLCYPRLTEAEKEFRSFAGQLQLPKGVALDHITSFEQDTIRMTIEFSAREQLAAQWPDIRAALLAKGSK